jgi:hypothetical protein
MLFYVRKIQPVFVFMYFEREDRMFISLDSLDIMVRLRCEDIRQESEYAFKPYKRSGSPFIRRALVRVGGLLVTVGMALEKLGIGQELYRLSTTAGR